MKVLITGGAGFIGSHLAEEYQASGDEVVIIDAEPVESVVDATGAGDMYAAGFIYGFVRGKPIEQCGKIGSIVASEVITHMGPRPLVPLTTVVPKSLH